MAVDIKKIKVGDKITIEIEVKSFHQDFCQAVFHCTGPSRGKYCAYPQDIIDHTPAPVPVRVGQKFKLVASNGTSYEVVAEYKGRVVYASIHAYEDGSFPIYSKTKRQLTEAWLPINEDN